MSLNEAIICSTCVWYPDLHIPEIKDTTVGEWGCVPKTSKIYIFRKFLYILGEGVFLEKFDNAANLLYEKYE